MPAKRKTAKKKAPYRRRGSGNDVANSKFGSAHQKLDSKRKLIFLEEYSKTGRIYHSAAVAGVCGGTVTRHRKTDEDFDDACNEALRCYHDDIEGEIHRRAIDGWDEPVFDYKGGGCIGHVRKFSDRLLVLQAQRHIKAYQMKGELDVNVSGGVLVVGGKKEEKDWEAEHGDKKKPVRGKE